MKKRKIIIILMSAVVLFIASSSANGEIVSNSKILDDIEYYMQVDDSVYELGENVEMLYRVTNLQEEEKLFGFGVSPENNFWIEKDGEDIWRAMNGWFLGIVEFTLLPDESKEYTWVWDMTDSDGFLIEPGVYDIIGGFGHYEPYEYSQVSVR